MPLLTRSETELLRRLHRGPGSKVSRRVPSRAGRAAWSLIALFVLVLPLASRPAASHEIRPLIATVTSDGGSIRILLSLNLEAAMAGIGPAHDDTDDSPAAPIYDRLRSLDGDRLSAELDVFAPRLTDGIALELDGMPVELAVTDANIPEAGDLSLPRYSEIILAGQAPPGNTILQWRLDPELGDSVLRLLSGSSGEVEQAVYIPAGESSPALDIGSRARPGWGRTFMSYLQAGFVHIVPKGLDHILFVVGLFLLSTRLSALLWQVSAFTLAHTATLVLAALGVIRISPSIVEPLIALSIAWIGIENLLTDRMSRWRPFVVFAFGLLHGLGFAGVLEDIGFESGQFLTALVAFNIGVELGQIAVILGCLLLVGWFMRAPMYRRAIGVPGSLAITCIAMFWAAERAGLS